MAKAPTGEDPFFDYRHKILKNVPGYTDQAKRRMLKTRIANPRIECCVTSAMTKDGHPVTQTWLHVPPLICESIFAASAGSLSTLATYPTPKSAATSFRNRPVTFYTYPELTPIGRQ
jgi:hypothetical protein